MECNQIYIERLSALVPNHGGVALGESLAVVDGVEHFFFNVAHFVVLSFVGVSPMVGYTMPLTLGNVNGS